MVASKPEKIISQLLDEIETKFRRLDLHFRGAVGSNEERIQAITNQPTSLFNTKGLMILCNGNNVVKFGNSLTDAKTNFYQDVLMNSDYIANLHDPLMRKIRRHKIMLTPMII